MVKRLYYRYTLSRRYEQGFELEGRSVACMWIGAGMRGHLWDERSSRISASVSDRQADVLGYTIEEKSIVVINQESLAG